MPLYIEVRSGSFRQLLYFEVHRGGVRRPLRAADLDAALAAGIPVFRDGQRRVV